MRGKRQKFPARRRRRSAGRIFGLFWALLAGSLILALLFGNSRNIERTAAYLQKGAKVVLTEAGAVYDRLTEVFPGLGRFRWYGNRYPELPEYEEGACIVLNDNIPDLDVSEYGTEAFESYSPLDLLGRCGPAFANIGPELMPDEARESISQIHPSGWNNRAYDFVDGKYLYNRCHLIGYQLTGENANERNLITGTRWMNVEGMLPFENLTAEYIRETGNHVLYRVTPVFTGRNLVADGVKMEARSVEDDGAGVCFCVFVYNIQPGVEIDYSDGENWAEGAQEAA